MKTLTNKQWTIAFLAIWSVAFLILWLTWEMSARGFGFAVNAEFRWWALAIYAAVFGVATYFSIKLSASTQTRGSTPNWKGVIAVGAVIAVIVFIAAVIAAVTFPA
jgi:hypothetical protein